VGAHEGGRARGVDARGGALEAEQERHAPRCNAQGVAGSDQTCRAWALATDIDISSVKRVSRTRVCFVVNSNETQ
jgi:hypothetical protein